MTTRHVKRLPGDPGQGPPRTHPALSVNRGRFSDAAFFLKTPSLRHRPVQGRRHGTAWTPISSKRLGFVIAPASPIHHDSDRKPMTVHAASVVPNAVVIWQLFLIVSISTVSGWK